jgi:hypothetical protein
MALFHNAIGVWFTRLPILPEDILRALGQPKAAGGGGSN